MNEITGRNWRVIVGDVIDSLRTLADNSVHCCVTSPPYWGLRDYGVEGQIGLEATPKAFTDKMTEVFAEVRRVLRPDGTCWVNIGDSYATGAGAVGQCPGGGKQGEKWRGAKSMDQDPKRVAPRGPMTSPNRMPQVGLKPKDLVGIPWRLAFALQDAGWWLRSEIIWHKKTPMPESVTDRPTKSHEQIFLLTKAERYFFDQEAVKEKAVAGTPGNKAHKGKTAYQRGDDFHRTKNGLLEISAVETRNIRTVWSIAAESYKGAHFATFPSEIPRRAILAGTSEKGCCVACGAPWIRVVEKDRQPTRPGTNTKLPAGWDSGPGSHDSLIGRYKHDEGYATGVAAGKHPTEFGNRDPQRHMTVTKTMGWKPSCECGSLEVALCVVLDCFSGSGTTGMVATELGRQYIGCELNPEYAELSRIRIDSWKKRDAMRQWISDKTQRQLF